MSGMSLSCCTVQLVSTYEGQWSGLIQDSKVAFPYDVQFACDSFSRKDPRFQSFLPCCFCQRIPSVLFASFMCLFESKRFMLLLKCNLLHVHVALSWLQDGVQR